MSKHTPGPWKIAEVAGRNSDYQCITDSAGIRVSRIDADEADARLIAAAPELLGIARRVLQHNLAKDFPGFVTEIEDAIAKAEGRT